MNHTLPKLPPVNDRRPINLDASIARAINANFKQMALATARLDAGNAGATLLRRVTGQRFTCRLEETG